MNQGRIRPGQILKTLCDILPDERKRLTRHFEVPNGARLNDGLFLDWGTVDDAPATGATAGFAGLRLIDQDVVEIAGKSTLVRVYETIPATDEVQVGGNTQISLEDGRTAIVAEFLQFTAGTYVPGTVGTTTAPGDSSAFMQKAEQTNDGTLRRIKRTYVYAGLIQQNDSTKNNGKLLIRTLTYVKTTPPTPSGYVVFSQQSNPVNGIPVHTYGFAKGEGEISRRTSYDQSDDQGTTGVTTIDVTHLTASSVGSDPVSSPGGTFQKVFEDKDDQDGYRIWRITYTKGTGTVSTSIRTMNDGTREVTYVSLGSRVAPSGIVTRDDTDLARGYERFTVSTRQWRDGTSVTGSSLAYERFVPFTYPGRAKAFSETYNSRKMLDIFKSPPVTTQVQATITISYQTGNTLGTISDYWNPSEWATYRAQWIGFGDNPNNVVEALPGYRSVSSTPVTETCSAVAPNDVCIFGRFIYGDTTAKITVTGGPGDPGGTTKTLFAELEPAFTDAAGTQYYRKTLISAAIPAQASLPV